MIKVAGPCFGLHINIYMLILKHKLSDLLVTLPMKINYSTRQQR